MSLPNFLVIGAPKAGTSALHVALSKHPDFLMSRVKEPKFFLCDGPPPRYRGPGDAHSSREWVWRRDEYERLFESSREASFRGESTPLYLSDRSALERIAVAIPDVRLIAVLRDPIDRAYSNWAHLWADGLEPVPDFLEACALETARRNADWAPFWRYLGLGLYGEQLRTVFQTFPRDHVHVLRYKDLVDSPADATDAICEFLGAEKGLITRVPVKNVGTFVGDSSFNRLVRLSIRAGAWGGQFFPPRVWRRASKPLLRVLQHSPAHRPELSAADRASLVPFFEADVRQLESETGLSFEDWLADRGSGTYSVRKSWAPSRREVS